MSRTSRNRLCRSLRGAAVLSAGGAFRAWGLALNRNQTAARRTVARAAPLRIATRADLMETSVQPARALRGSPTAPGDKSISHRAAILSSIAEGTAVIENFQNGADCRATLSCLRLLGVPWRWLEADTVEISGVGLAGLSEPPNVLDCRNSGTTMRMLAGLLAAQPFLSVLSGDASLRSRPMGRVIEPLRRMGADIRARDHNSLAPPVICGGSLVGIEYDMPVASAQVKSSLLLAGLYARGETTVREPSPSRDHTELMLQAMGADITSTNGVATIRRQQRGLKPLSLRVPGDISAAAFWLVAGAAHPEAQITLSSVGVNPRRTGILDALRAMGADIDIRNERLSGPEPVADIDVHSSTLTGTRIGGDMIPRLIDEIPLIALAASQAHGETVIQDAAELRVKESDRIRTTVRELRRLGVDITELPDGLSIKGPTRLRGGRVSSHGDHRLAMMLGVAALLARESTTISNSQAVSVSYPRFWEDLKALSGP